MRYAYPVEILEEADGVTVTAPDVPGMITCGDTRADALVTALSFYTDEDRLLPAPSPAGNRPVVTVPLLVTSKLALHAVMVEGRVSNVELGRRMGVTENSALRLRNPLHRSHVGQVETALQALGRRAVLEAA